jgi:hypothetical protein
MPVIKVQPSQRFLQITRGLTPMLCFLALIASASIAQGQEPPHNCDVNRKSDLFRGLDELPDWTKYKHMVEQAMTRDKARQALLRRCPRGPSDPSSRDVLFSYFSQELDFLEALSQTPNRGGVDCGECEGFMYRRDTLRTRLAQIADPSQDGVRSPLIARLGDGETMARFGPAIEGDVRLLLDGDVYRDRTRALETLGLWLSPSESRFSSEEKSAFRDLLVAALPRPAVSMMGNPYFLANSALKGLGHATDVESEKAVQEWLDRYDALGLGPNVTLARSARESLQSIRKNRERPIEK